MESQTTGDPTAAVFHHAIIVRYGECDMQGVVFNPNYLVYVDDVCDRWLDASLGRDWNKRFDLVVKKASVEWQTAAHHGDRIDCELAVTRWGNTSFDVTVDMNVGGKPVVSATVLYISVAPGSHSPVPVPAEVRTALSTPAV